ncbi:MAG: cell division protein FtsL [Candidatus Goldbacteria bacterium]|nr:cell division protein FtsL [Candidatus Goldiibacteriota bacterium]
MVSSSFIRRKYFRAFDPKHNYSPNKSLKEIIFIIIFVFLQMFICVWLSSQTIKYNYKINEISKERDRLKIANRALEIKLQSMMSSDQIAKIAKERYGFKTPSDGQVIIIKKDKSIFKIIFAMIKGEKI